MKEKIPGILINEDAINKMDSLQMVNLIAYLKSVESGMLGENARLKKQWRNHEADLVWEKHLAYKVIQKMVEEKLKQANENLVGNLWARKTH